MRKRRHHYIPEVLCKRFTKDRRTFFRLDSTKLEDGAISMSIKDAFVEKDLNTINLSGTNNTTLFEDFLDKCYERTFGKSINKVFRILFENEKDNVFEPEDYFNILNFCILSYLRTPKKLREIHIQSLRRSYLFSIFPKPSTDIPVVDKNYILSMTLIEGVNAILKHIKGITLRFAYHTFEDEYFLLPDNPVALVNSNNMEFTSPDLDIILPISSKAVLIFSKTEKSSDITHIIKRETVENINRQLCDDFSRFIACADKEYLEDFFSRNKPEPQILQTIEDIEAEKEIIISEIKDELKKNPIGRYIKISKKGIEFLN